MVYKIFMLKSIFLTEIFDTLIKLSINKQPLFLNNTFTRMHIVSYVTNFVLIQQKTVYFPIIKYSKKKKIPHPQKDSWSFRLSFPLNNLHDVL